MANQDRQSSPLPKREPAVYARRRGSLVAARRGDRWGDGRYVAAYRRLLARHKRLIRRIFVGGGATAALVIVAILGLWWRLDSGPIQIDAFTPWLASAIEENFGSHDHVEVGGTQIERTENGGTAVRIRDIVVRDADGAVVAKAPKAEVRVSALSLLSGHMRARSLNLVGAELNVRIDRDGEVTVFAGAGKHPIATATVPLADASAAGNLGPVLASEPPTITGSSAAAPAAAPAKALSVAPGRTSDVLAAMLSWIDGIGESGLDGHDLRELGLKEGTVTFDDERSGKNWSLHNIRLSLERPAGGGVVVTLGSEDPDQRWALVASVKPIQNGVRSIEVEARQVPGSDLIRAFHLGDGNLQTTMPFSASVRGEIGADGVPRALVGRLVAEGGSIGSTDSADGRINVDHAEFKFSWDDVNRVLSVPFQIVSGGNRFTLLGQMKAPAQLGGTWYFKIGGGTAMLAMPNNGDPLILNRIAVSGWFDPAKKRFVLDEGDIGNLDIGVFMSGDAEYADGGLRLHAGLAGKRMSLDDFKRLWPVFVSPKVRDWVGDHLTSGTLDHITIAVNAPFETLKASGPPIPENGLSIDALVDHCVVSPVSGLPALKDADLTIHIVGRDAQVWLGKATADLPSGRKLTMSSGLFEVPDTAPHDPPARVHFKLDGPVPAAAELLSLERLRDVSRTPFDPATSHGTMTAQVALTMPMKPDLPPGSTNYSIMVDATNFSAEHLIMGQRLDAPVLHVTATPQGFGFKGDVKIAGAAAYLEYHQARNDPQADIRLKGTLDAAARKSLGLDPGDTIGGSIPMRIVGRVGTDSDHEGQFSIDADLTPAKIDGFLPGWVKPAGKPAHVSMTLTTQPESVRIDNLAIAGAGTGDGVKGSIELDSSGNLQTANFQSYGFSDGDKATLKAERAPDGALRVTMRGDVYDGRGFIKTMTGGAPSGGAGAPAGVQHKPPDVDLDIKLGAVLAFNGEALSDVDLKMSRRAGEVRSLGFSAKIGQDGALSGQLQGQASGRQTVILRTTDAGALFRATDVYKRMVGGQMAMVMEAPSSANPTQQGTLNVRNFNVHDESELQRAATGGAQNAPPSSNSDLQFTSMRVDFTRAPGRIALRDGVVRGPMLGGTIDGLIDYTRRSVDLRGTLVPLYGANNMFGWIPVVGPILGGDKEGLVGFTYEVVGQPGNPVLNVNFFSVLAPGVLRKIFQFPATTDGITLDDQRR
jgi:hypothetical protein